MAEHSEREKGAAFEGQVPNRNDEPADRSRTDGPGGYGQVGAIPRGFRLADPVGSPPSPDQLVDFDL